MAEQSVQYCMDVSRKHGQEYAIITCDQAIYEVVLGLQKKNKEKYANLAHGWLPYCSELPWSHLMQSTGIEDIMVEADVCLRGTANIIISGKDYYALLHAHAVCSHVCPSLVNEEKDLEYM